MEGHTAIGQVHAGSPWASGACTRSNPTTFTQFNSYIYECNRSPKCRYDHRLKQDARWKAEQLPDGTTRWTTPSGRTYTAEPTRYPV
jgi:hypothetical protein